MALADLEPGSEPGEAIGHVLTAGQRASDLVRKLLVVGKRRPMEPETFVLKDVVSALEPMLTAIVGEEVELQIELHNSAGCVRTDQGELEHALLNMAANARDAMPKGGRLKIQTCASSLGADDLSRAGLAPGKYSLIEVRDTGTGMSDVVRSRIFEPFFTTKLGGQGIGLGLATAYSFAAQAGGVIDVQSQEGQGAAFRILLPSVFQGRTPAVGADQALIAPRGTETILLVEDEPGVRTLLEKWLTKLGYVVLAAETPLIALEILKEKRGELDLLLTDVVMPVMDGAELHSRARKIQPGLGALLVSGYADDVLKDRIESTEPLPLLMKPFTLEELAQRVRDVLDGTPESTS
jgi:CheY-like chemotaxis protein